MKRQKIIVIIFFIIIGLFLTTTILTKSFGNLDEVWQYDMAKNIAQGKLPYIDFNIIVTPLLPMITAIFLNLFGNQMIVMRIVEILLQLSILITTYLILRKLKMNSFVAMAVIIVLTYITKNVLAIDYNFLILEIILIITYLELRQNLKGFYENNKIHYIIVGILAGLSICTKQTIGLLISVALILYKIFLLKNVEEMKYFFKSTIFKIIGISIPVIALSIYFTINDMWESFISYCILGIKDFSNSISYLKLFGSKLEIKILAIAVPLTLIYMLIIYFRARAKQDEYHYELATILPFAVANMVIVYPIADNIHFLIAAYPTIIAMAYIIYTFIKNKIIKKDKVKTFIKYLIEFAIILLLIYVTAIEITPKICEYITNTHTSTLEHFKYIPMDEELEDRIKETSEYILKQHKVVHILDAEAAIFDIPIDRYDKNYDLFTKGNLGLEGEEGQIEEIEREDDAIYLVKNSKFTRNWQSPEKVVNYILQNMEKIGTISIYDIYIK